MSSQLMKKITGRLTDLQGQNLTALPVGTTVEFTKAEISSPGSWIGAAVVDLKDGYFELLITYDMPVVETVNYRVLNNKREVQAGEVTITNLVAVIEMTDDGYNDLFLQEANGYTTIKGKVTLGEAEICASPVDREESVVTIMKVLYPGNQILATGKLDIHGRYELKVPNAELYHSSGSCADTPEIYCSVNQACSVYLSDQIRTKNKCHTLDVWIKEREYFLPFKTEADYLVSVLETVPNLTLSNIPLMSKDKLRSLAISVCIPEDLLSLYATGMGNATAMNIAIEKAYALARAGCSDIYTISDKSDEELWKIFDEASARHIISNISNIQDIADAREATRGDVLGEQEFDNGNTMLSIFTKVLNSESDARLFLQVLAADINADGPALWTGVAAKLHDAAKVARLQKAMQLLAITGMQPEITTTFLNNLDTNEVRTLSSQQRQDVEDVLAQTIADNEGRSCIPEAITETHGEGAADKYIDSIYYGIRSLFATDVLAAMLRTGHLNNITDNAAKVASYLEMNQDYDLYTSNVWSIDEGFPDTEQIRSALMPLQNLTRLVNGDPDAVAALANAGIRSSSDIAAFSQEDFVVQHGKDFNGSTTAMDAYSMAVHNSQLHLETKMALHPSGFVSDLFPMTDDAQMSLFSSSTPIASPDMKTLFGSLDSCNCTECTSMYSPGAYFTDILNFMRTKMGVPTLAYTELLRRRPDLIGIDLTCKNANTPLPYVDLVNELLELEILKSTGATIPFTSYQTSGTAKELEAYPEHTYKNTVGDYVPFTDFQTVYNVTLKNGKYPNNLPFSLPVAESRTYLKHLNKSRYDLMYEFRPKSYGANTASDQINELNALAEWLNISRQDVDIICNNFTASYGYYGFGATTISGITWYEYLCQGAAGEGLNTILARTRLHYKELLQLLICDVINPKIEILALLPQGGTEFQIHRTFEVEAINTSTDPTTCDLTKLRLRYKELDNLLHGPLTQLQKEQAYVPFLGKLHAFLRLQRATGWSPYQLDIVLKSLGITGTGSVLLDTDGFKKLARIHQLSIRLNLAPELVVSLWSEIDLQHYINFDSESQETLPSVYDRIFRNKAVLNPPYANFMEDGIFDGQNSENKAELTAALGVGEEDFLSLLADRNISIVADTTLSDISVVYGLALLARGLNISVSDLLTFRRYLNIAPSIGSLTLSLDEVEKLALYVSRIPSLAFSTGEMAYLCAHVDEDGAFTPDADTIKTFYTTMRADLQKLNIVPIPAGTSAADTTALNAKLDQVIVQYFASQFGLDRRTAAILLQLLMIDTTTIDMPVISALKEVSFIASAGSKDPATGTVIPPIEILEANSVSAFEFSQLFSVFRKATKAAIVINKLRINPEEIGTLEEHATDLGITSLVNLPLQAGTDAQISDNITAFIRLNDWYKVRDKFQPLTPDFLALLKAAAGASTEAEWMSAMIAITRWDTSDLEILKTHLELIYASGDYRYGALILQMATMMESAAALGLSIDTLTNGHILTPAIQMEDARTIRMAAKAGNSDEEWAKVAKPLQDTLREAQRQALVAYMLGRMDINGVPLFRDENELYDYFLIDVEMKPCMKTSRIKQGISSVQLFVDRVILSLENVGGVFGNLIHLPEKIIEQWESWRKWYRVWEANRKIFLYPENWIEPELRDDKTPFFKDLETQLLQDAVTDTTAEDAFAEYLERVDEVSRLEPVSAYHQTEPGDGINDPVDIVHVFARTYSTPHRYFYRKLENNEWTPWEKMNVDIKSDQISPVFWNRRMYIFWLTFKTKRPNADSNAPYVPPANVVTWTSKVIGTGIIKDTEGDRDSVVEVTLNWSQLKGNKWLPSESCPEVLPIDLSRIQIGLTTPAPSAPYTYNALSSYNSSSVNNQFKELYTNRGDMPIDEFFRNRVRLYTYFGTIEPGSPLAFSIQFAGGLNDVARGLHAFVWPDNSAKPRVLSEYDLGTTTIAPAGTRFEKSKMVQYAPTMKYMDNYSVGKGYYLYYNNLFLNDQKTLELGTSTVMLNQTPNGRFKLTSRSNFEPVPGEGFPERNPITNHFFFEDNKNTFYVRKETGTVATVKEDKIKVQTSGQINLGVVIKYLKTQYPPVKSATVNPEHGLIVMPSSPAPPSNVKYLTKNVELHRFHTFYHAQIGNLISAFNKGGVDALLKLSHQDQSNNADSINFYPMYVPNTSRVHNNYPRGNMQFDFDQAYSIYNWELFFHAPMMIAQRLSENQQFEEARKWYHYIFNPTNDRDGYTGVVTGDKKRFWNFQPFYNVALQTPTTLQDLIVQIHAGIDQEAMMQLDKWEKNPFKPHVIARIRKLAYMKNVVMKYLDNLFAWADQLFRRDTIESINEATQLYILAAKLLGKRPEDIPARAKTETKTFSQLLESQGGLDALSNAMVEIESYFAPNSGPLPTSNGKGDAGRSYAMFYFCLPKNSKLLGYWDTLADRLFKIRNCMNIDGTFRQLALYEPPIDPALLVKAAAKGISIDTILNSLTANSMPAYRFSYVLQKANEFCSDVRSLGSALLSALEKKDAEQLALLRSGQEHQLLEKVRYIKEAQVEEANANLESAMRSKENAQQRQAYYASRVFMNSGETQHLQSLQTGMVLQTVQGGMQTMASALAILPQLHAQATFAVGPSFGGQHMAAALNAISSGIGIAAAINNVKGNMALTRAGYERRRDDWQFQATSAAKEMEQLDQQILAAEIRLDMANKELVNHELQISNNEETDAYMRSKFSNTELYSWMSSQIAATYFQSYQLAFDMAKKAESCFDLELPLTQKPASGFIGFAYWDSLRKGLMSGEKLQYDLRKMEAAYMDSNKRELELSKNISLVLTQPKALLDLRRTGSCSFQLLEELFDLDYPGHYLRRIKSVSLSIPCIAGPYTTIAATLDMTQHGIRKTTSNGATGLIQEDISLPSIATSTGQNDGGVFELNFRDERYLPFEGRGAVSTWNLRLADSDQVRLFDFDTISDVIVHIKYTAREDGGLKTARKDALNTLLHTIPANSQSFSLPRYFSLRHEFSQDWYRYAAGYQANDNTRMVMKVNDASFPFFCKNKKIKISSIEARLNGKQPLTANYKLKVTYTQGNGSHVTKTLAMTSGANYIQSVTIPDSDTLSLFVNRNTKVLQWELRADNDTDTIDMDALLNDVYFVFTYQVLEATGSPSANDVPEADPL